MSSTVVDSTAVGVEMKASPVPTGDERALEAFYHKYDYTMVFPMAGDEDGADFDYENPDNAVQTPQCRSVINHMLESGFELYTYLSVQKDELYVLIDVPVETLSEFADKINFKLRLDAEYCRNKLAAGIPENKIKPVKIADEPRFSSLHPYDYIYGKYEHGDDADKAIYEKDEANGTIFSSMNRKKLIYQMMTAPKRDGGCKLEIEAMLLRNEILALYPSRNHTLVEGILSTTNNMICKMPWNLSFSRIRDYLGEKYGFFFVFLGHQTKWLAFPMIFGLVVQCIVWGTGPNYSHPVLPFYGVFACVWMALWLSYWKQTQADTAMQWGMIGYETTELDRPQFRGSLITSPINGQFELWYPATKRRIKLGFSYTIILFLICMVVGALVGIYVIRFALEKDYNSDAATIASFINTIQITIFNLIYQNVAVALNDAENHKTNTQYQDSLIAKVFLFQFVNSFISFFYIAFVAAYLAPSEGTIDGYLGQCGYYNCMQPLSNNIAMIFASRLVSNNLIDIAMFYYGFWAKKRAETSGTDKELTPPEEEYCLLETDPMADSIILFSDVAIQFGFSILFVVALPISFLATFFSNVISVRMNIWRMVTWSQRPTPASAEDIGTWQSIMQIIVYTAVFTNGALICFTMDTLKKPTETFNALAPTVTAYTQGEFNDYERVWIYWGFCAFVFLFCVILSKVIPEVSEEVTLQMKRNEFIVDKLINKMPDEDYDEDDDDNKLQSMANDATSKKSSVKLASEGMMGCFGCGSDGDKKIAKKVISYKDFPIFGVPYTAEDMAKVLTKKDHQLRKQ